MLARTRIPALLLAATFAGGCGGGAQKTPEEQALLDVKAYIQTNLDALKTATQAIRDAAPAPDADGWSATTDQAAVTQMKTHWKEARKAYESVEGAIAVLFGELDISTDERYDGFIQNGNGDSNLFDDQGVTGIHAIERILWSDSIPERVVTFESGLPGYVAAAFPQNQQEASDFKDKLCKRLVDDVEMMRSQLAPRALDTQTAYRGIIGSMNEQVEKAIKAAGGEEESRYAQYTLADMRNNVAAGVQTFDSFEAWLLTTSNGATLAAQIKDGFQKVQNQYSTISGDALPPVPEDWTMEPSAADLATPFGQLYKLLTDESNPDMDGSLVNTMNKSADALQIPRLPE
jgi:iron uptake system component EfeO